MVARDQGTVRVEIVPWLTHHFGGAGASRVVLDEHVAGPSTLGDFLLAIAPRYSGIGAAILDVSADSLYEHVTVVHNDVIVSADTALAERVEPGDTLVFLPAFSGG